MSRTVRTFVITPLLFICMIIVPAAALSADGYLSMSMFQSPLGSTGGELVPPPAEAGPAPAEENGQQAEHNAPEESSSNESSAAESSADAAETETNADATETEDNADEADANADAAETEDNADESETNVNAAEAGDAQPQNGEQENGEQAESAPPAAEVEPAVTMTDTTPGGTVVLPETNTPTPTSINVSPPATPTPTSVNYSPPPTPRPIVTVLPPVEPTSMFVYPTPMRAVPTPTPEIPSSALRLDGYWVQKVIGDRFSSVIYAYANEWLYRSENDGTTWTLATSSPAVNDFIMNADNPNVLFSGNGNSCDDAAANGPMLKSNNGGLSWFALPDSAGLRPLLTHPFKPEIVVAANCQWFYVSEDGGNSWQARPDVSAEALWHTYTIVSAAAVYTEDVQNPDDLAWLRLYVGAKAADGSGVVAYTEDLGKSWTRITPNVYSAPWGMSTIALDLFNVNRNWFADNNGVWYTPDGGTDWRFTYQGLDIDVEDGAGALVFMVVHPTGQIYLGTEHGLYTKVFDGVKWTKVADTAFDQTRINSILFTETNANLLYLNTSDGVHLVKIEG